MVDDFSGALLRCIAGVERGQSGTLVSKVTLDPSVTLMAAGVRIALEPKPDISVGTIMRALAQEGIRAAPPVEDSADRVLEDASDSHAVWTEALQYMGNFYTTAFLEGSPRCRILEMEYGETHSLVRAAIMNDEVEHVFTVSMDGSYDVVPIAFDVAYALKNGIDYLE